MHTNRIIALLLSILLLMLSNIALAETRIVVDEPLASEQDYLVADLPLSIQYALSEAQGTQNDAYYFSQTSDAYHVPNPANGIRTTYRDGTVQMAIGEAHFGLTLDSYGYGDTMQSISPVSQASLDKNRLEITHGHIREWYVNGGAGVQQGFTIAERMGSGELYLNMRVSGSLTPHLADNTVTWRDADGQTLITYGNLMAYDAHHQLLPVWMELNEHGLALVVDDRTAVYPIVVDPLTQQAYFKASNTEAGDLFGYTVAISGDTIVVGAYGEGSNATGVNGDQSDNNAPDSGAAYVFVRSGGIWTQQAYLKASNTEASDLFGWSVAISGDTIVVGTYGEGSNATGVNGDQSDNSATNSGAAYVFVRSGTTWTQQAYLKASNTEASDLFGYTVAISGDTIVVGAYLEDSNATGVNGNQANNSASASGAAYVFVRSGTTWTQQAYLKASNTEMGDYFGNTVAISGETIVVGAYLEDSNATGVNGDQSNNSATDSGAAYVFVRSGTTWTQQAYLKASNTEANDWFGYVVAINGDTIVVGAIFEDSNATGVNGNQSDNSASASGAAYVFVRSGTTWTQQAYLKASNTEMGDYFGLSVAINGDTIVVGAYWEDSNAIGVNGDQSNNSASDSGAAYVFIRSGTTWTQQAYLKSSNTGAGDRFGLSVAINGDTIVVGAYLEDSNATGVNGDQSDNSASASGAAYVFVPGQIINVVITPTAQSVVIGNNATYTAVLTPEPSGDVTIALTVDDEDICTIAPDTLTFTTADWDTPQTVTVTLLGDVGDVCAIRHEVVGGTYDDVDISDATVTIVAVPPSPESSSPEIGLFDPAISKIGLLLPGDVGIVGERLEWVTTVSNRGAVAGVDVVITDTLRPELRIDSVSAPGATVSTSGQTVTVTYANIAPGQTVNFSIFTTVLVGSVEIDNTVCLNSANNVGVRCATGSAIGTLPATGETPLWTDLLRMWMRVLGSNE